MPTDDLTTASGRPLAPGPGDHESDRRVFRWAAWVMMAATFITFLPLWLPMVLAAWFAHLVDPLVTRLQRMLGDRRKLASAIVLFALLLLLIPITVLIVSLIRSALTFGRKILASPEWRNALEAIVSESTGAPPPAPGTAGEKLS